MFRLVLFTVVLACAASSGCKEDAAKTRAKHAADAKDFWPEAPKPTIKTGTRTFRYAPANIGPYHMLAEGGSTEKSFPVTFKMILDLDFRAGAAPTERNAHIKLLDMWMNAGPMRMAFRMTSEEFYFEENKEVTRIKRGDPDATFDVADLTERPISILSFDATDGKVQMRANPEHPFATIGGGAEDMLDNALVLFPDLPQGSIAPGHRWSATRNTPVGTTNTRVDVAYDFEYVGDGACPSGAGTCSLLAFTASSPGVDAVSDNGLKMNVAYGFAGKIYFNQDRGIVDESRVRADIDVKNDKLSMGLGATYTVKPGN